MAEIGDEIAFQVFGDETVVGVILGDALTGRVSPLLILVSVCTATLGIGGLAYERHRYRRERER